MWSWTSVSIARQKSRAALAAFRAVRLQFHARVWLGHMRCRSLRRTRQTNLFLAAPLSVHDADLM